MDRRADEFAIVVALRIKLHPHAVHSFELCLYHTDAHSTWCPRSNSALWLLAQVEIATLVDQRTKR
eukprot:137123-Rhodomonas_salina.1